jgi:hypothetical protein
MLKQFIFTLTLSVCFLQLTTAQSISSDIIVIAPSIAIEVSGGNKTVKEGDILTLKAKGGDDNSTYQWQVSTDNKTWSNVPKATGNVFETMPIVQGTYFRVVCKPIDPTADAFVETISNTEEVTLGTAVASTKKK